MNKARKKVLKDIKTGEGLSYHSNTEWYWKLRSFFELFQYWTMIFGFPISILIWIVTGDYWKGLAFLFICQIYNISQNLRGLFIHVEHLIEWTIKETV